MTPELVGQAKDFLTTSKTLGGIGVVGDLCIDRFVFGAVDRISPEAPVPVLWIDKTKDKLGCAANVAENLAVLKPKLDFKLSLVGVVGTDATGDQLVKALQKSEAAIDVHVLRDSTRPTTLKTRFIAGSDSHGSQHQLLRVDDERIDSLDHAIADKVLAEVEKILPQTKVLIVQDYAKGLFSAQLLFQVLSVARKRGVLTIIDPNRNTPGHFYTGGGLITPNVPETEAILGHSINRGADDRDAENAARELKKKLQLDMAIITRSAYGMTLVDRDDKVVHFPAIARAVYDVTGAGDTVVALLAAALAGGASASMACTLAMAAASVVVGKVGTATAYIPEILKELEEYAGR